MSSEVEVAVQQLPHGAGLALPAYQSAYAAGLDLRAAVPENEPLSLRPMARALVPTGLSIALPPGFEAQVRARSGLAYRHGIGVLNAPGTIDADYRGEVQVLLINLGAEDVMIERGIRIAQLIVAPMTRVRLRLVAALPDTQRGPGGFGSTGAD